MICCHHKRGKFVRFMRDSTRTARARESESRAGRRRGRGNARARSGRVGSEEQASARRPKFFVNTTAGAIAPVRAGRGSRAGRCRRRRRRRTHLNLGGVELGRHFWVDGVLKVGADVDERAWPQLEHHAARLGILRARGSAARIGPGPRSGDLSPTVAIVPERADQVGLWTRFETSVHACIGVWQGARGE